MRAWPSVSAGYEELSLWDPPCQGLAAAQPVPAPCRVTAAAPAHPGACSGHGHGARRGRAGLWGRGCCGAGVPGPTSPSAPITAPVALPCSRVMASTSRCSGPRLRRALHSSLGGAGLGWEALHLPHGPPCPTASWALPSTHHCALPAPVHSPGPWGGGSRCPGAPQGRHSQQRRRLRAQQVWIRIHDCGHGGVRPGQETGGYQCLWGGCPPRPDGPQPRPLQIHDRHPSPCSLGALHLPSCPCHGHRVSRLHLCPVPLDP